MQNSQATDTNSCSRQSITPEDDVVIELYVVGKAKTNVQRNNL